MLKTAANPNHGQILAALLLVFAGLSLLTAIGHAETSPAVQAERFEARVATVRALLEASQRITAEHAPDLVKTVEALIKVARADQNAGRTTLGAQRLDDAYNLVKAAIVTTAPAPSAPAAVADPVPVGRTQAFETRLHSVEALSEALSRIRATEGVPEDELAAARAAELTAAAGQQQAAGDLIQATAQLDEALGLLKGAIVRHRAGVTLVRELQFASAEDEYNYELDRHRTHLILTKLVLDGADDNARAEAGTQAALADAERLRDRAYAEAGAGRYEVAVQTLEDASMILIRILRANGLPIPG